MRGEAKFWYHALRNRRIRFDTWATFRKEVLNHYYPGIADADASLALTTLKYDPTRPVIVFYDKLDDAVFALCRRQFDRADRHPEKPRLLTEAENAHQTQLYTHFLGGLPAEMRTTIMSQQQAPQNAKELLRAAQKFEQQRAQLKNETTNDSQDVAAVHATTSRGRG